MCEQTNTENAFAGEKAAMVIYRKLKTQIMLTTATWLHTKLAAKIHRIEYGFEPRPMSQPLLMYCTSVSPGDFAHLSVILLIQQL